MFSLPSKTAPADFRRRTTSASSVGTRSLNTALAAVVRMPCVSMRSLSAIGMPWSGPRHRPRWISLSASRACCSAWSAVTVIKALTRGFRCSMRVRKACASSTGETDFRRRRVEASTMPSLQSSGVCASSSELPIPPKTSAPRTSRRVHMPQEYTSLEAERSAWLDRHWFRVG